MTKRDKPAMSEEEFEAAIKELAQKEFATGKRDDAAYRKLCMPHGETVSPDRKAIYESSMRKTGGKMNAACMFWKQYHAKKELLVANLNGRVEIGMSHMGNFTQGVFNYFAGGIVLKRKNKFGKMRYKQSWQAGSSLPPALF